MYQAYPRTATHIDYSCKNDTQTQCPCISVANMTNEDLPSEIDVSPIDAAHDYREQLQSRSVDNCDNPHGVLATLAQDNPFLRELLAKSVGHLGAQHPGLFLEAAVSEILAQGQYDTKYDNSIFYKVLQPLAKEIETVIAEQGLDSLPQIPENL